MKSTSLFVLALLLLVACGGDAFEIAPSLGVYPEGSGGAAGQASGGSAGELVGGWAGAEQDAGKDAAGGSAGVAGQGDGGAGHIGGSGGLPDAGTGGQTTGGSAGAGGSGGIEAGVEASVDPCQGVQCGQHEQCAAGLCTTQLISVPLGFSIDATEVTRAQYAAWLATGPSTSGQSTVCSGNLSFTPTYSWPSNSTTYQLPVVGVDWCDAAAYCSAVGKHLCGAIGGGPAEYTMYKNPGADKWYNVCSNNGENDYTYGPSHTIWCNTVPYPDVPYAVSTRGDCKSQMAPVFDMTGNVAEWEDSCSGSSCRLRGGSFLNDEPTSTPSPGQRCDADASAPRMGSYDYVGFRCCQ